MSVLIVFFTAVLLLLCAFIVLVILMQKPNANGGMGSALGGGVAEQAFGGDAANVLTRTTVISIVAFFVISFLLYMGNLAISNPEQKSNDSSLENIAEGIKVETPVALPMPELPALPADENAAVSLDALLDTTAQTEPVTAESPVQEALETPETEAVQAPEASETEAVSQP
jgi:preprotein translocase subunit SecG